MKKIISLILAVAVIACLAVPAFAAAKTYTWTLTGKGDYEGATDLPSELKAGDVFYVFLTSDKGYKGFSLLLDVDTDVFEVAKFEGQDDVAFGNYTGAVVMNPNGMEDKVSFTAANTAARPPALSGAYIGFQVKEGVATGEYAIAVSTTNDGILDKVNVQMDDSENVGNSVTVNVKGVDPVLPPSNPEINTDNDAATEADDAKTWAVAVDANYAAAGDVLVATLTNNGDTQVVNLTVGNDVVGGADWAFNLKVRFKDVANRATTTLAIAKAAN